MPKEELLLLELKIQEPKVTTWINFAFSLRISSQSSKYIKSWFVTFADCIVMIELININQTASPKF